MCISSLSSWQLGLRWLLSGAGVGCSSQAEASLVPSLVKDSAGISSVINTKLCQIVLVFCPPILCRSSLYIRPFAHSSWTTSAASSTSVAVVAAVLTTRQSSWVLPLHWLDASCVSVGLSAGRWWKNFANFIWATAILNSCEAVSEFIGLYVTTEQGMLHRAAALLWNCTRSLMLWQEEKRGYYIYGFLSVADSLSFSDRNCKTIWVLTKYGWHKISLLLAIYKNVLIFNASTHCLPGELLQTDWTHHFLTKGVIMTAQREMHPKNSF